MLGFLQLFSGGALTNFAVFALGIMPYITSSIIMQILTVVIPKLEQWQKQGAVGQRKITQWTRYLTIAIAILQSTGLAFLFHNGGGGCWAAAEPHEPRPVRPTSRRSACAARGADAHRRHRPAHVDGRAHHPAGHRQRHVAADLRLGRVACPAQCSASRPRRATRSSLILLSPVVLLVAIVFIENGQRRIPVQFAKRVVGRRMYGGQSTYIPLKVNQSGVIPIIFASSVLYLPLLLTNVLPTDGLGRQRAELGRQQPRAARLARFYIVLYGLLIIGFAYFYTAIAFDPAKQADTIRKQGGFIPGIRPGPADRALPRQDPRPASRCPARCSSPPSPCCRRSCSPSPTSRTSRSRGTSILIAVGVALETMKQIDSQLMMRNYEGFLK